MLRDHRRFLDWTPNCRHITTCSASGLSVPRPEQHLTAYPRDRKPKAHGAACRIRDTHHQVDRRSPHRILQRGTMTLSREEKTVEAMVRLFCRSCHGPSPLCPDCAQLLLYAKERLHRCPYGEAKPTCAKCPTHCYAPAMRSRIIEVMRYAGPRMILHHPWMALMHAWSELARRPAAPRVRPTGMR